MQIAHDCYVSRLAFFYLFHFFVLKHFYHPWLYTVLPVPRAYAISPFSFFVKTPLVCKRYKRSNKSDIVIWTRIGYNLDLFSKATSDKSGRSSSYAILPSAIKSYVFNKHRSQPRKNHQRLKRFPSTSRKINAKPTRLSNIPGQTRPRGLRRFTHVTGCIIQRESRT